MRGKSFESTRLGRAGIIILIIGLSLLTGLVVRDSTYINHAQSSTTIVPPNSYYIVTIPSHYRIEELDILVNTDNGTVQVLILKNEYNISKIAEGFPSQHTFWVNSSKSIEFMADYGLLTLVLFNPGASYVSISYTIWAKSLDYGVLLVIGALLITGIMTILMSFVRFGGTKRTSEVD